MLFRSHHNAVEAVRGRNPSSLVAAPAPWACHGEAVQAEVQAVLNEASLTHGEEALCRVHMEIPEDEVVQGHVAERGREPVVARAVVDQHSALVVGRCHASVGTCLLVVAHAGPVAVVVLRVGLVPQHTSLTCRHHGPLHQI